MNFSEPNVNDNANENWRKKLSTDYVDTEAKRLALEYGNAGYEKFYCKAIYQIGPDRLAIAEGKVKDAKFPGRLLTKLLQDDMRRISGKSKLDTVRKLYGEST